jgi:hypothetical protein
MDAWDLVMRALSHYWRVTRQDMLVAQALLEKAIAIDPNYGQALGVLAATHTFSAHMGWMDTATSLPIAERAALAAIRADNEDPWAHLALGYVNLFRRRFDDSLAEFELALRLNPNFSLAQGYYSMTLSYCGRWEEGDVAARRALRLSPRDPFSAMYCGIAAYAQFLGRNYDEAMRLAGDGIRQRGDFVGAHRVLTAAAGMGELHGRAEEVIVIRYRLAGVNAYSHSQTFGRISVVGRKAPLDVSCGADRVRDIIERGHDPVAGVLYLASMMRGQSASDQSIVHTHQLERRRVAEACRHFGRSNNVGKHDGTQPGPHFWRSGIRSMPRIVNAAEECLHSREIDGDDI